MYCPRERRKSPSLCTDSEGPAPALPGIWLELCVSDLFPSSALVYHWPSEVAPLGWWDVQTLSKNAPVVSVWWIIFLEAEEAVFFRDRINWNSSQQEGGGHYTELPTLNKQRREGLSKLQINVHISIMHSVHIEWIHNIPFEPLKIKLKLTVHLGSTSDLSKWDKCCLLRDG